jgi:NTE family protein
VLSKAQPEKTDETRPKVAVVLSGGGAKGFAHIGALKVLEQEGIPVDIIVGTSMGSLIGGFYSLGYTTDEIEEIVKSQNWEHLLSDNVARKHLSPNDQMLKQRYLLSLSSSDLRSIGLPQGIIKGQNVLNLFCGLAGNVPVNADFSQLPISYACVAADMETGNEVILNEGFFPTALFASMAIPGAFQSMHRNGLLLVDGGIVNNFPTDVAKNMGADIIIGVDLRSDYRTQEKLKSMDAIFNQIVSFMGKEKNPVNNSLCDIIIHPDITGYSVGSFSREAVDTLILRGEKAALQLKDQIRKLKEDNNLQPRQYSRQFVVKDKWQITDIQFSDSYNLDKTFLKNKLGLEIPGNYSRQQIKNAIDRLYGYGGFDLIYYSLTDNATGKTLHLNIVPQKIFAQRIGFKVNTNDAAAVLLNITRRNYEKPFGFVSLSAELSANPGGSIVLETNKKDLPTLGMELKGKYQKYDIYEEGDKLFNADIFYSAFDLYVYKLFLNKLNIGLGIQEEYFNGDVFTKNNNSSVTTSETDQLITNARVFFNFDDMDNFYFPTKGSRVEIEFSAHNDFSNNNNFSKALYFSLNKVTRMWPKTVLLLNLYNRSLFDDDYPLIKTTLVGGEPYSQYFNYHLPFVGLPPVTVADRFTSIALVGIRVKMAKNQYISLLYNMMAQGNDFNDMENYSTTGGGGIKYSVDSMFGPIDIGIGYSEKYEKPTFSANLGFWF